MAIVNPNGEMQYWDSGFPYQGLKNLNTGEMQYWDSGFPMQFIFSQNTLQVFTLLGCGT